MGRPPGARRGGRRGRGAPYPGRRAPHDRRRPRAAASRAARRPPRAAGPRRSGRGQRARVVGRPWAEALGTWAVAAVFLFIVGDALPRSLARVAPELAASALPLARRTLAPFGPLLWLLAWVDKGLHSLVATRRPLEPDLGAAQRDMLLGVFTLADTRVDEVMTPRLDMVAVDLAAASDDVIEAFRQSEHSRLPVYDGTPDNIAGVVFAKDLVPFAMGLGGEEAAAAARWQDLVRPAAFVPETKTLDSQLRDFQRGPAHL